MSYNIYQFTANSRLSDNDIKFRYIKAFGEITPENLLKLETIFEYEPDKQKQHSLRRMVEEHEQRVEQRARDLEQARLKEARAEQLRKEAESIKQKIEYQSVEKMEIFIILHLFRFYIAKFFISLSSERSKHQKTFDMNRIKEVLEEKGIKQTWLAEKIGKSFSQTNAYVCNRRQPSLEQLFEIAKILGVDAKKLIDNKKK